jgi:hypothetical protein
MLMAVAAMSWMSSHTSARVGACDRREICIPKYSSRKLTSFPVITYDETK